ncbi:polyribonucleotide nucleotidyltransferase [Brevibacillus sp. H7]|uniref:polyribonucleotide nucleotidyltransferase n=1 Tax=Brevibacillus sp. H7 TaxID=3349138 RepID=UPI0038277573
MNISNYMGAQLASLQHAVSLSVMNMAQTTQAAGATVMLEDFAKAQAGVQGAPHPTLGQRLDVRV